MQNKSWDNKSNSITPIQSVKDFYFLDYIYILLDSVNRHSKYEDIFVSFLSLKRRFRLGESKYKKLTVDTEDITDGRIRRYLYTFNKVLDETSDYGLIEYTDDSNNINLTEVGKKLLSQHKNKGSIAFNESLLKFMEHKYNAFRYLIGKLYAPNRNMPGLLFLPSYSPRQLGFDRQMIKNTSDFISYSDVLVKKLEKDIQEIIGVTILLGPENKRLLKRLMKTGLLSPDSKSLFNPQKYNAITKRFRDFWMTYFLQQIYHFEYSMHSFDIWTYRGKQMGIVHATEFHPYFNGKIVYPLSVIMKSVESKDFSKLYTYSDRNGLFVHKPKWSDDNQEKFVEAIVKGYYGLRRAYNTYFVNLMALREIVCLDMKIPEKTFDNFMSKTYKLNLSGKLPIRISLEVDKLPEETGAMYLKREPVMIDNKYRNIIAIDATKGV
ncbi:hypothetical protein ACFLRP_00235 [Bacteroidota bacterium]